MLIYIKDNTHCDQKQMYPGAIISRLDVDEDKKLSDNGEKHRFRRITNCKSIRSQ